IIWRVSGDHVVDYIDSQILDALGMERSSFRMTLPRHLESTLAKNYSLASTAEEFAPGLIAELAPDEAPASGLATTGLDMTRFMIAHLQGGKVDQFQMLKPETLQLMHQAAFTPMPGAQPIALGLFRSDYK